MSHAEFPAEIPAVPYRDPASARSRAVRRIIRHAGVWLLLAIVVGASVYAGFRLRQWTWEMTGPIHFRSDITRGYNWGREAADRGYFNLYEKMAAQESKWENWLDYAPLRLAVMTGWGHWTKAHFPEAKRWQADWAFNKPVLLFNTAMELLGAACAFLLVRLWLARAAGERAGPFTGWLAATVAGLLFWFNPAILLSAHGWPTWDMWIMPMYLLAVLLASSDRWFAAGVVVAVGAMFKGQQLVVAPIFLVWPLILWRFDAILKWTAGLLFGIGLLAIPWLLFYVPAEALEAMRAAQSTLREPWKVDGLTLPNRVADVPAMAWVIGVLIIAIAASLLLARRATAMPLLASHADVDPNLPNRLRSRPTVLRYASAQLDENRLGQRAALATLWIFTLLSFILLHFGLPIAGWASEQMAAHWGTQIDLPWIWLAFWKVLFVIGCIASLGAVIATRRARISWKWQLVTAAVAMATTIWPWLLMQNRAGWAVGFLLSTAFTTLVLSVSRRHIAVLAAGACGAALLLCPTLFHGSDAWWICGWKYGTFHWPWMYMGVTSNLPGLLVQRYGWAHRDTAALVFQLPAEVLFGYPKAAIDVTIKQLLAALFAITLLLSAVGIGLQARRRDPRILIAFTAPWLMFFCFPVQVHERYLLYAAGVGAITIGAGVGPAMICLLLSAFTWIMTMHVMLNGGKTEGVAAFGQLLAERFPALFEPTAGQTLHRFIQRTFPDIAWAILLSAAIFLYLSLTPSRRRRRDDELPALL